MDDRLDALLKITETEKILRKGHVIVYDEGRMSLQVKKKDGGIVKLPSGFPPRGEKNDSFYMPLPKIEAQKTFENVAIAMAKTLGKNVIPINPWEFEVRA